MVIVLFGILGCQDGTTNDEEGNESSNQYVELARVHGKSLYLKDLPILAENYETQQDSINALLIAVNRWVKDELLIHEASKNIPDDLDIDQLVEEYRLSLIKHHFEQKLVSSNLDTVVTEFDLKKHLEENRSRYSLEKSIMRCLYIKVRKPVRSIKKIEGWLDKPDTKNLQSMRKYCMDHAEFCLVNPEKWYKWEDVKKSFPSAFKNSDLRNGKQRTFADFKYQYFIHILEFVSSKDDAPLSYFEEQATKLIIRERKNRLLEDLKDRLYENQKSGSEVKIFVNE